jgi:hypothetical protein
MGKAAWMLVLLATGCASLTPREEAVIATENPEVTAGCKFLGRVEAGRNWGKFSPEEDEKFLKRETAKLGGNVVFLNSQRGMFTVRGEAYLCEQPKP